MMGLELQKWNTKRWKALKLETLNKDCSVYSHHMCNLHQQKIIHLSYKH